MIRWRFVVHAAIDGYSRLIPYLYCATNNKASTVMELFQNACQSSGLLLGLDQTMAWRIQE